LVVLFVGIYKFVIYADFVKCFSRCCHYGQLFGF